MTISEILSNVLSMDGATMGRANKTNFVIVPVEDGYAKVEIKAALAQDTAKHKAFNAEAAGVTTDDVVTRLLDHVQSHEELDV